MFDIQILTLALKWLKIEKLIAPFLKAIMSNHGAIKPNILEIFEWLLILVNGDIECSNPLNEDIGPDIMHVLVKNH